MWYNEFKYTNLRENKGEKHAWPCQRKNWKQKSESFLCHHQVLLYTMWLSKSLIFTYKEINCLVETYQIQRVSPSCSVLVAMGFFSFVEFSFPERSLFPSRGGVKGGCCP